MNVCSPFLCNQETGRDRGKMAEQNRSSRNVGQTIHMAPTHAVHSMTSPRCGSRGMVVCVLLVTCSVDGIVFSTRTNNIARLELVTYDFTVVNTFKVVQQRSKQTTITSKQTSNVRLQCGNANTIRKELHEDATDGRRRPTLCGFSATGSRNLPRVTNHYP